jgi:cation diffusion facilitator CzcD-associated flavoprotein CzcO
MTETAVEDENQRSARTNAAQRWLQAFESAVNTDDRQLFQLFSSDGWWRDVLAFTWTIVTFTGKEGIEAGSRDALARWTLKPFRCDMAELRSELSTDYDVPTIQVWFNFKLGEGEGEGEGRGRGLLRLVASTADDETPTAWALLTALEDVGPHESPSSTKPDTRIFGGPNWFDRRERERSYIHRDPTVLIVGGGQAGLSVAARLKELEVDALIVDRHERIGDNWRKRYHALELHNETWANHLPLVPFPDFFPTYLSKDKLANWFESYVDTLELNYWPATTFRSGEFDPRAHRWLATLEGADGTLREIRPRHIVIATGVSGIPYLPDMRGLEEFAGDVLHSTSYTTGTGYAGKDVLVVGTGSSGHDIAQDLQAAGAKVTMLQRGSTSVVSLYPSVQMWSAAYHQDKDTAESDFLSLSAAYPLMVQSAKRLTKIANEYDKELIDGLHAAGFRTDVGEDATGWQMKYFRRGGGYYINVGCSELIVDGKVAVVQDDDIAGFESNGLRYIDGTWEHFDACILATGYLDQQAGVRAHFGEAVAEKVGRIWGYDENGETKNVWKPTPQASLWFAMGSLTACRIYSKFLARQIWAAEAGLLSDE